MPFIISIELWFEKFFHAKWYSNFHPWIFPPQNRNKKTKTGKFPKREWQLINLIFAFTFFGRLLNLQFICFRFSIIQKRTEYEFVSVEIASFQFLNTSNSHYPFNIVLRYIACAHRQNSLALNISRWQKYFIIPWISYMRNECERGNKQKLYYDRRS